MVRSSRRSEDTFVLNDSAAQKIINAAEWTAQWIGTKRFVQVVEPALRIVAADMSERMTDDDRPGLFVPANISQDGAKPLTGAVLTLEDRAILAWITGTFRIKNFVEVVPYRTIADVSRSLKAATTLSVELPMIRVSAERSWDIVFDNVFEGGRDVTIMLAGILSGAVTFGFDDGSEATGDRGTE